MRTAQTNSTNIDKIYSRGVKRGVKRGAKRAAIVSVAAALALAWGGLSLRSMHTAYAAEPAAAAMPAASKASVAKAQGLIDKAVNYLKTKQQADGGWQTANQPIGITSLALRGLAGSRTVNGQTDWVKKGYDKLLKIQLTNGGFYQDAQANYNTAISVSTLAAANNPEYKQPIEKAVAYLKTLQWTETIEGGPKGEAHITPDDPRYGGAGYGGSSRPDGSNTQIMLDALRDAGLSKDDPAFKAALKFVTRLQNLSETNDQPWAGNDGGAAYTPANGGDSMAGKYKDAAGKDRLKSYGSMTYAMLKSYIYCGLTKEDPRVKAAWEYIRKNWTMDENPGMADATTQANPANGLYYYYMTLARALDANDEPTIVDAKGIKHDWRLELIDKLATIQKEDGRWEGIRRFQEDNPVLATSYVLIALEAAVKDLEEHPPAAP